MSESVMDFGFEGSLTHSSKRGQKFFNAERKPTLRKGRLAMQ
jgi:hypothetical protein